MNSWTEAAPWLLAILGWFATHFFSEARERRKEVRSQVDKLLDRLVKIEGFARDFHTSASFDEKISSELLSQLNRLEGVLGRISRFDIDNFVGVLVHLRRSITLNNFDKSKFSTQSYGSQLLSEISGAIRDFEDELEGQYALSYPSKLPYFNWSK